MLNNIGTINANIINNRINDFLHDNLRNSILDKVEKKILSEVAGAFYTEKWENLISQTDSESHRILLNIS